MPFAGRGVMLSLARKSERRLRGSEEPECAGCQMNAESTGAIIARHAARRRQSVTLLGSGTENSLLQVIGGQPWDKWSSVLRARNKNRGTES